MWEIRKKFKDYEQRKVFAGVLDEQTLFTLYKLSNKGYFEILHGFIKQGKESCVLLAEQKNKNLVAVKIHAIAAGNFKKIWPYLEGDPRFYNIKHNRRAIIFAWCKKEFKNMKIAFKANVPCPEPIAQMNNVLIMEFLGEDFKPAPRLVDIELENPEKVFNEIIEYIKLLYKANLVHGDLSFYNILWYKEKPYFIDFSQGVLLSHPNAQYLLKRDITNICNDFKKYGIEADPEKIYEEVVK
ncbi:MAG TPA: serine protein kinase RIO [Nanoarchaeota archaeon]|nr:serine protein kinase RIO [Nanoarchaeota archaeon]